MWYIHSVGYYAAMKRSKVFIRITVESSLTYGRTTHITDSDLFDFKSADCTVKESRRKATRCTVCAASPQLLSRHGPQVSAFQDW